MKTAMHSYRHKHIKKSFGSRLFDVLNYSIIILFCISIIFPVWDMIVMSFSSAEDVSVIHTNLWPKHWSFDAYAYCFKNKLLSVALINTIMRTILGTLYHLSICCLTAFALTRMQMPFRKPITMIFLFTMFFSGGLIPTYLNIKNLGLLDNFFVYVLPSGFSMYNTIVIRNYFLSIDRSLEESATLDGASMLQVMYKIILPLSMPVLATVGLWQMVGQWNSWFDNMVYCRSESLLTLQYLLRRLSTNVAALQDETEIAMRGMADQTATSFTPDTIIAATTVLIIAPIICVYPFLQRYFVKGIMLGAVKG